MKNHIYLLSAFVFLLGLNLLSCVQDKSNENKIKFDKLEIKEKVFLLSENDTTLPYSDVKFEYTYPVKFNNKEDLAQLQQIFNGTFFNDKTYDSFTPQEALNKYLINYIAEYRELADQYRQDKATLEDDQMPSWYWYYHYKTNEILFNDPYIVSYSVEHSEYTGGAHGSMFLLCSTIDLNKLTTVTEEDIFKPNYFKFLTSKIIEKLMEKYEVTEPEQLLGKGFFDINEIAPNNNFWMNDKGVHYVYNQYEIAPYSMGPVEVTIPIDELESIIIPESTAGNYIK